MSVLDDEIVVSNSLDERIVFDSKLNHLARLVSSYIGGNRRFVSSRLSYIQLCYYDKKYKHARSKIVSIAFRDLTEETSSDFIIETIKESIMTSLKFNYDIHHIYQNIDIDIDATLDRVSHHNYKL